jgi:hypothetical protein
VEADGVRDTTGTYLINLKKVLRGLKRLPPLLGSSFDNIGDYIDLLNPYNKKFTYKETHFLKYDFLLYRILRFLVFSLPVFILRKLVLPEICMPIDQYILYQHRNSPYVDIYYHPSGSLKVLSVGCLYQRGLVWPLELFATLWF